MGRPAKLLTSRYLVWLLLYLPLAWFLYAFQSGRILYGEMVHATGELSARLMMLALAATPIQMMFRRAAFPGWLRRQRRHIGVAAFAYAALHTLVYLARQRDLAAIAADAVTFAFWTGWIALLIFLALAATSNDLAMRLMRDGWKKLHRWVYVAAVLLFAHWIFIAFDPVAGIVHLLVLASLEIYRVSAGMIRLRR